MAHFALLWKARTIEKYRLNYEIEKYQSILAASTPIPQQSLSQRWRYYRYNTQKRISMTFRRLYPEGSSLHNFFLYFQPDQSCLGIVLKSLLGFSIGIGLTYLSFLFFVFQLSISLLHATIMSSIIGVLLTIGLAFSYRIRCLIFLLIPQFFSRAGRYTLTCYALVLILTGPATNTLKNSEVLSASMACQQEQLKTLVNEISHSTKKPHNLMKDSMKIMVARLRQFASEMKETILKVNRLVLSILQVIQSGFSWLSSLSDICNKNIGTPYERCKRVLKDGVKSCEKRFGPKSQWICNITDKAQDACLSFRPYKVICVFVDLINGSMVATIKKRLRNFSRRIRSMLYIQIHISHSYTFSGNTSHSPGQVAAGIVTEIRKRADPILTWLSWSSCVTSLFLLLIIFRAKYYQRMFDTRSRFDNRYITKEMRDLDLKRLRQGRETVLPLNRRERSKYITTTSFRLVTSEKVYLNRSAVFMAITSFKLMIHMAADYSLYWVLTTIRYHGKLQTPLPFGLPNSGMQVSGSGRIAGMFRSLLEAVTTPLQIPLPSHTACLPDPHPPDLQRYAQIGVLICLLWFFALFEPYGLRLRHVIMGRYRPERAKARAEWLYNHILRTRGGFMKFARRKLHKSFKYTAEEKHTFKAWLRDHIPLSCLRCLLGLGPEELRCLLCGTTEYKNDRNTQLQKCDIPRCIGVYCSSCFADIGQLCTVCLKPKDYGDLSDISLEKGSSDESDEDSNDDINHERYSNQENYQETHVDDVNDQTPLTKLTKKTKWNVFHSKDNNGGLEQHKYDSNGKRIEKTVTNSFKSKQEYYYNHGIKMLKGDALKLISCIKESNANATTEIELNIPKESGCHVIIFVNRITATFHGTMDSRDFMVCPLVTMQNVNKNIILRNCKDDIHCRLKIDRPSKNYLNEINIKQRDIHFKSKHRTLSLNFYDIDMNKKNIEVNRIIIPLVSMRYLLNVKNQVVKKRSQLSYLNRPNANPEKNRYFMTLNDETFTNQAALNVNEYSKYNRNKKSNNTNKNKGDNGPAKEIIKQNFGNDIRKQAVSESKDKKSSCCFQTICHLYQHRKCNKSTGCPTYTLKTSDVQKNHKRRKKRKDKAKLGDRKSKICNHNKNHEDARNYRILAYLDEQDWTKRTEHSTENDENGTALVTADENRTFDVEDNLIINSEQIVDRDKSKCNTKGTANLKPNCVVQNCDLKNLYLSKEQSIQLKINMNTSFDTERRLAFYNQLGNQDYDQMHLNQHKETGIIFKNVPKSGESEKSSELEMLDREPIEHRKRGLTCGICCTIRQRLQNILDEISKFSSRSRTCIDNIVDKVVSIIPGDTCGVDCEGDEKSIDDKEESPHNEEHLCTCKELEGYELIKKISSHVRKYVKTMFITKPAMANKGENTTETRTCKEYASLELVKKISSHVRKCMKTIFKENVETANKSEKNICACKQSATPESGKPGDPENQEVIKCENAPATCKQFTSYELVKKISSHVRKYMKSMFEEKTQTVHEGKDAASACKEVASHELDKKICSHVKRYMKIIKLKEKAKADQKSSKRHKGHIKIAEIQTTPKPITDSGCQCGTYGQDPCNESSATNNNKKMTDGGTAMNKHTCLANKNVSATPEVRNCSCQYYNDDEGTAERSKGSSPKTLKQHKKVNEVANLEDVPSKCCHCMPDLQISKSSSRPLKRFYKNLFKKKTEADINKLDKIKTKKSKNKGKQKKKHSQTLKDVEKYEDGKKPKKRPVPPVETCHCQHEEQDSNEEDISRADDGRQTVKLKENQSRKEKKKRPKVENGKREESPCSQCCSCQHDADIKNKTQPILKKAKGKAKKKQKPVFSKRVGFHFRSKAMDNKEVTAAPRMHSCSCQESLDPQLIQNNVAQTTEVTGINTSTQGVPSHQCCACGPSTLTIKKCTCASQYHAWDIPGNSDDSACLIVPQKNFTVDENEMNHLEASNSNCRCSTPNTSSLITEASTTDTTVCCLAYIHDRQNRNRAPRAKVATKSNRGTTMEKVNVCDVSTLTSDWWSPILEKKNVKGKDIYLEKKRCDFKMHKNYGRKERETSTDGKYVSFRSRAQLIPDISSNILSPARYLLESQKHYNELFSSKRYAPTVYPVNMNQNERRPGNRSSIGSNSRRNHRAKRLEDTYSPRKQVNSKKRPLDFMVVAESKNQKLHKKKNRYDGWS